MYHNYKKSLIGFTLAEVLITLGIIGVVAAMTMPSLIANHKEKEAVTRLKKVYSTLDNAYMLARNEHTDVLNWFEDYSTLKNSEIFFNNLKPYLNIAKECGREGGCLTPGSVKTLDGRKYGDYNLNLQEYRFVLADGTQVVIMLSNPVCRGDVGCGNIKVDIDGSRGSYTMGKDFFIFNILPNGIYPAGAQNDTTYPFNNFCNRTSARDANGRSCAAWVIYNENMDYLHCDDLNWDTKTKC